MADSEFDTYTKAAKAGRVQLKPQAALDCANMCADLIHELNQTISKSGELATVTGFGNLPNATDLAKRYADRANPQYDSSMPNVLTKHRDVVNDMMETFIASGRAYLKAEDHSAADLSGYTLSSYDTQVDSCRAKTK
ncbi:hypothetical protein [Nocardia macrotermitis]|uniref:Uncharacterized protein n=1 Tax=Nocardia macrotermitis TaxID=2585198 RepID=A0A7K0D018_9NOCA|nr:hypothetical protein [Nocardia macrotermitis]MQY19077.1 hypothetical protein [Nocardia macrotermitis]